MLSPFDEVTGGTGDWDQCMAVSFFPLIASSSFLPLFLPSYLFALLWCGLFGGPQPPRRWHEVPCSRKVSPALCPIMSPSMCYFSCLLLCIPSTSSCVPCPQWLLLLLNCVWVVAVLVCGGLFLSIAKLGPQGWPLQPVPCHPNPVTPNTNFLLGFRFFWFGSCTLVKKMLPVIGFPFCVSSSKQTF